MIAPKDSKGAIVITGASTGIGEACARRLDGAGYRVFAGVRRETDAERLRDGASGSLTPIILDVTRQDAIGAAAELVSAACGGAGLQGLVNNAGICVGCPLEYVPLDELRRQLEVNVVGQIAVTQAFLPLLRVACGRIINIGSMDGRLSIPFMGAYAASKHALEALNDALRMELRPWGIRVVIIEPGAIATPIWEKSIGHAGSIVEKLPDSARVLYGPYLRPVTGSARRIAKSALPAETVARLVERALTTRRPKARYVCGRDATLSLLLNRILPTRLMDKLILREMTRDS